MHDWTLDRPTTSKVVGRSFILLTYDGRDVIFAFLRSLVRFNHSLFQAIERFISY